MDAFYFGDSARPLFGIHHPAAGDGTRGVLICGPVGQEYMRTHWVLRQLAVQLARAGVHVLRFDYTGVGESAGEGDVAQWREDVATAAQELKDRAGVRKISVVGLRLGAALAATADGLKVRDLVLWDPVVSGAAYLAELQALHAAMLRDLDRFEGGRSADPADGLVGFPVPVGLDSVDLAQGITAKARRTLVIMSEERAEYAAIDAECRHVPDVGAWGSHKDFEEALLANDIVAAIAKELAG